MWSYAIRGRTRYSKLAIRTIGWYQGECGVRTLRALSRSYLAAGLEKLREAGVRRRAEQTYQQLDFLMGIRKETRKELLAESGQHPASECLQQIPRLGLRTRSSGEYRHTGGQLQHARKPPALRGLNVNHNHELKNLFKSAATQAGTCKEDPLGEFYQNLLASGMEPPMARLTLAREIAAIALKHLERVTRADANFRVIPAAGQS
jgi:hypothetical protein